MPAGMQNVEGQLPGPPAFRSALISSQILAYSGVSGGWPASGIQLFGLPGPRLHCPLKFGYFPESSTWAVDGVASSAAANATTQNRLRSRFLMGHLQLGRSARDAPSALFVGRRWPKKSPTIGCRTIHPPPLAVEGPPRPTHWCGVQAHEKVT